MSCKKVKKKTEIKQVRLTNNCTFDCTVNPIDGNFIINIEGQISNIRDYIFPLELQDVSVFASTLAMMALLGSDPFRDISIPVSQNPKKYLSELM